VNERLNSHLLRLQAFIKAHRQRPITELLAAPGRCAAYGVAAAGLYLDYSKQNLDDDARKELLATAASCNLVAARDGLLAGAAVNTTEQRPALHTLLRASALPADADDTQAARFAEIQATRSRMSTIAEAIRTGTVRGFTGEAITHVINIGIGGSDLGPRLVATALTSATTPVQVHFVSNIDPADLASVLAKVQPAHTLFIVCSKSFSTEETRCNAMAARAWLQAAGAAEVDLAAHFYAVTSNIESAVAFGIPATRCLPMWDWVGGRFSVWSAVGLSCAIALGWQAFADFLAGAETMDHHFASAPLATNMPVLLSMLEFWNCTVLGAQTHAVLPYSHALRDLPAYLQQLTMESNGKSVDLRGRALGHGTAPVLWGGAGTVGQHSFHQLLHQGKLDCPVDFILPVRGAYDDNRDDERPARLVANCLAQSRALMLGRSQGEAIAALEARGLSGDAAARLAPHLVMPGNRPSSTLLMDTLAPATLGALLALYEHRTFCSGVLWDINPFDQWGVELGKEIGAQLLAALQDPGSETSDLDTSTRALLTRCRTP